MKKLVSIIGMVLFGTIQLHAQIVDEIVAVVADKIILRSDIEIAYEQASKELGIRNDSLKCKILEMKLIENLMVLKAQVDSIPVSEERVDAELDERIRYFAQQYGGEKALEEIYGKSISEIKATNRERIRNNQLKQAMESKIVKDVKVNPTDIKSFYSALKVDSLPYYSAEVELAQIVIEPKVSKVAKMMAYEKITELRKRIVEVGEKFSTLALIYSDDKGSASKGGELGYFGRGMMVPEFEGAAFRLKPDSVSRIIETKYGYHIIMAIQRKGEEVNARHILIMPKIYSSDVELAQHLMDSIVQLIKMDSMSFETAARKFSDDENTKASGGIIGSGGLGNAHIPVDELSKELNINIQNLEVGEMSEPEMVTLPGPDQKKAWRVFYLKSETPPHRCNPVDDYQKLQAMAFEKKQRQTREKWIARYRKQFYVQINGPYANCPGLKEWGISK
ncbi:MAG: peptidylprolyl isomerase [Bacteroidota bacterium]|nr:peptidylprolyl isomerase [Bacteroidota bacterium]